MNLSNDNILYLGIILVVINILFFIFFRFILHNKWISSFFDNSEVKKLNGIWISVFIAMNAMTTFKVLEYNLVVFDYKKINISLVDILGFILGYLAIYILNIFIIKAIDLKYQKTHQNAYQSNNDLKIGLNIKTFLYSLFIYVLLQKLDLDATLFNYDSILIKISSLFFIVITFMVAKIMSWIITELFLYSYYSEKRVEEGAKFAVNQLLKYIFYFIAIFISIEHTGINFTVLWGGGAALMVGLGLGLQQTFNDLISGIILLFERTVEVEDVVQIGEMIGTVKKIGLRTSIIETRDNITVVVPNSKLVVDSVINWSHYDKKIRYKLYVGVAYGTDTSLVKRLLLQTCNDINGILKKPEPRIRLKDFGDSSLDFEVIFWSKKFQGIEDVKSDMRFEIDNLFRVHNITIPFPQRDIRVKNV